MCSGKHGRICASLQGAHSPIEDLNFMATYVDRDSSMAVRRNQFLTDFMDWARSHLGQHVSPQEADLIASDMTDRLTDHWGGQTLIIPKDYHWKLSQLDDQIYREFTGNNYAELAQKHGVHERTLRRIIKRVQQRIKEAADKRSRDLFND